jgi:hypothetical protein
MFTMSMPMPAITGVPLRGGEPGGDLAGQRALEGMRHGFGETAPHRRGGWPELDLESKSEETWPGIPGKTGFAC